MSRSMVLRPSNVKKGSDIEGALQRALNHWSSVCRIDLAEFSGVSEITNPLSADGLNSVSVAGKSESAVLFAGAAAFEPALTRVYFNTAGTIAEADIFLNPAQRFSTDGSFGTFDLESVFTHELGHVIGLDHSSILGAVMQPYVARNGTFDRTAFGARILTEDDISGAVTLYGLKNENLRSGTISGTITMPGGAPVQGINVWAENVRDGRVVAGSITTRTGLFTLSNLADGRYRLYAAPLNSPIGSNDLQDKNSLLRGRITNGFALIQFAELSIREASSVVVNGQITTSLGGPVISVIGMNNQTTTSAILLRPGNTYTIYLGGHDLSPDQFDVDAVSTSSNLIICDLDSLVKEPFGAEIDVISLSISVDPEAPDGLYSISIKARSGEISTLPGAIRIGRFPSEVFAGSHSYDPANDDSQFSAKSVPGIDSDNTPQEIEVVGNGQTAWSVL